MTNGLFSSPGGHPLDPAARRIVKLRKVAVRSLAAACINLHHRFALFFLGGWLRAPAASNAACLVPRRKGRATLDGHQLRSSASPVFSGQFTLDAIEKRMGGDGMGAMAAAISAAMLLIVVGSIAAFLFGARIISRRWQLSSFAASVIAITAGAVGTVFGLMLVITTFYEDVWMPPPTVHFVLGDGVDPSWVVLLEDPAHGSRINWRGVRLPFFGVHADIPVSASGVVRVASLAKFRDNTRPVWPDGSTAIGYSTGPAPTGVHARSYAAWTRHSSTAPENDLPDGPELEKWIHAREEAKPPRH